MKLLCKKTRLGTVCAENEEYSEKEVENGVSGALPQKIEKAKIFEKI